MGIVALVEGLCAMLDGMAATLLVACSLVAHAELPLMAQPPVTLASPHVPSLRLTETTPTVAVRVPFPTEC